MSHVHVPLPRTSTAKPSIFKKYRLIERKKNSIQYSHGILHSTKLEDANPRTHTGKSQNSHPNEFHNENKRTKMKMTIENDDPNTQISNTQRKQPEELLLQVHKQNVVHDEHFVKLIEINTLLNKNLVKLIEAISRLTEEQSSTNENLVKLIEAISRLTEEQCLTNQHLKVLLQKQANDDGGEQKFTNSSSAMENKLG
ncbi:hypothetical protein I4U23_029357 [Adineta vaga]|nr:hypothetical protein I4U23_029357 [Adineta vaga]